MLSRRTRLELVALAAGGTLVVLPSAGAGQAGTLYLSPKGHDVGRCTRAAPCASFQRAYSLARAGATVLLAPGRYPEQTLSTDNPRLSARRPVLFEPLAARPTVGSLRLTGASNVGFEDITFGTGKAENRAWYQYYSSNTSCNRCSIRGQLAIDGGDRDGTRGTRNARFTNGDVGGYVANDADPQIGGMRGPDYPNQAQPSDIAFVNERFHDIDASSQAPHTECLQVLAVHGLLIRNSTFYNCNVHGNGSKNAVMFSGYDAHGTNDDYWNIRIENSQFHGGADDGNRIGFSWDNQFGFQRDCRTIRVTQSVVVGTVLWGCPDPAQTVVENTILTFQWTGSWATKQCNARFRNVIWESSGHCPGTNVLFGRPLRFVDRSSSAKMDLHLARGSFGYGRGIGLR